MQLFGHFFDQIGHNFFIRRTSNFFPDLFHTLSQRLIIDKFVDGIE